MPLFVSHNVTHENVVFWPFAVKNRDRGGGGASRAIALPLLLLGFIF